VSTTVPGSIVPLPDDDAIGLELPTITNEYMNGRLSQARDYVLVILKRTPKRKRPEVDPIIREHGRRNMALQQAGLMPIVCPVRDDGEYAGIGILTVSVDRATQILSEDPGVKAGIVTFEVHPVAGFLESVQTTQRDADARASQFAEPTTETR
jgi:hypothetical protein